MDEYKERDLKRVQEIELDILEKFISVCDKYSLEWIVIGGTALGAMRHNGFIPWDDDIDVAMPRKDYNYFLKKAHRDLPNGYFFQNYITEKNYNGYFSKIRKEGTAFVEKGALKLDIHHGIFIDIFPMDNLPDIPSEYKRFHRKLYVLFQIYLAKSNVGVASNQKHKFLGTLVRNIIRIISIPISKNTAFNNLDKQFQSYGNSETERLGFAYFSGMTLYKKELYPIKQIKFEKIYVNIPNDADSYLKRDYGNYMEIPPKEKRISHYPVILKFDSEYHGVK